MKYISHLNIGESGAGMMTETADHVASVAIIVRMAAERRVQAQLTTFVGCPDVLVNGVNSFQYTTAQLLKFAKFHRLFHAMVFQIIHSLRRLEGARAGNSQSVHIRKFALLGSVDVIGRSVIQRKVLVEYLSLIASRWSLIYNSGR